VTFLGNANFAGTAFWGDASFNSVYATKTATFSVTTIVGVLTAAGGQFRGPVYFANIDFQQPPDFTFTAFSHAPSFLGSRFAYPLKNRRFKHLIGQCRVPDAHDHYRRLKQLAAEAHDHEMELHLFALETKAKRGHALPFGNPAHWPSLLLNYLYEWTSGFGQSVMRPTIGLALVFGIALYAFAALAGEPLLLGRSPLGFDGAVWTAAAVNLLPFAGQAVIGRAVMQQGICPAPPNAPDFECLTGLYAISVAEGFLALIFLFLIGLGPRNRFRIK